MGTTTNDSPPTYKIAATPSAPFSVPATPLVRRIDHIIIRIDEDHYDDLYSLLADTLRLPTPWAPSEHPYLRSGGIFAGNVDFEILYMPSGHIAEQAELYGIVFEAWEGGVEELAQRGLAYLPSPYVHSTRAHSSPIHSAPIHSAYVHHERGSERSKPPTLLWTNYFLEGFLGGNSWQKLTFWLKKFVPDELWVRVATQSSGNAKVVQWIYNHLYRRGAVFMMKYNPQWRDIDAERRISTAQLEMRAGGILGLIRVKEVVVGTTQLTQSSGLWRTLLRPAIEETGLCWQAGDGPALRVITAEQDGIHHMVWEVVSLADAQEALAALDLLGLVMTDEITLDPLKCFGLDIRLVEAPGGFSS